MDLLFFIILVLIGIPTVFLSSALFLFRHFFSRESNFFSYAGKINKDCEIKPNIVQNEHSLHEQTPEEHTIYGFKGTILKGDYYKGTKNRMVVLVPGYGDSINALYAPASKYLQNGFHVFIVYPQGVGKSTGKFNALPYMDAKNLVNWLEYLHKKFDGFDFILHGVSFGAATVLQSISSRKFYKKGFTDIVLAAVADSAFTSLSKVFSDYYKHFAHKSIFQRFFFLHLSHYMSLISFLSGRQFFCNISPQKKLKKRCRYEKRFKKNAVPVLLLHGGKDTVCRSHMAHTLLACSAAGTENKSQLVLFEDAPHGLAYYSAPEKYMNAVFSFLPTV